MDLSFSFDRPFDREAELTALPHDLAVLMVGVAARQAASPTAAAQIGQAPVVAVDRATGDQLFRPVTGAFNGPMADAMTRWRLSVNALFTEPF